MQMNGSFVVSGSKESAMSKIATAKDMLVFVPDVVESEVVDDLNLLATVKAGIGFIKGKFKTKIGIEKEGQDGIKIIGSGTGSGSSMNFTVNVKFSEDEGKTTVVYDANVNVAGTAATMGQRIIEKAARDYVTKIMKNFQSSFN